MSCPPDPKMIPKSNDPRLKFQSNHQHKLPSNQRISELSSEIPTKKPRHDESWRPDTSQQQIMHSPTMKTPNREIPNAATPSPSQFSLDACAQHLIKKEMNKNLYENNKMREEMKKRIENVKIELNGSLKNFQKSFEEKLEVLNQNKNEKIEKKGFEIPTWFEERIKKIENNLAELTAQVNKISEGMKNPEIKIEERIAAVVEEKLELQQRRETPISRDPKWFISEAKCREIYQYSQGQVARFLADYLPMLYDLPGIITPFKSDEKGEEARAVIDHFWNGSLSTDLCIKEIEKEHANQRYKTSRKIYQALKNSAGCIMSKSGSIYECNWDDDRKKYFPKSGDSEILRPRPGDDDNLNIKKVQCEWQIPRDIFKEKFEKDDYMIVAKNDDSNQTKISKIDLYTFDFQILYTKRKYGSN